MADRDAPTQCQFLFLYNASAPVTIHRPRAVENGIPTIFTMRSPLLSSPVISNLSNEALFARANCTWQRCPIIGPMAAEGHDKVIATRYLGSFSETSSSDLFMDARISRASSFALVIKKSRTS